MVRRPDFHLIYSQPGSDDNGSLHDTSGIMHIGNHLIAGRHEDELLHPPAECSNAKYSKHEGKSALVPRRDEHVELSTSSHGSASSQRLLSCRNVVAHPMFLF